MDGQFVVHIIKKCPHLMELEGPLPCSQEDPVFSQMNPVRTLRLFLFVLTVTFYKITLNVSLEPIEFIC
jgi:hypothetical protein